MHSHIAAYRFVHLRGLWLARPLHPGDTGPVVAAARDGAAFCLERESGGPRDGVAQRILVRRAA